MLVSTVACGGNLLMNVGPTGRGELDPRARAALEVYARWMHLHERSIRGCTASEHVPPSDCRYTQRGNRLYCHVFAWPFRRLHLDGLAGRVEYAQLLHDASEIPRREPGRATATGGPSVELERQALTLELPVERPDVTVPVIELFLR
jgi:alpha-L-fucosidase